MPKPNPEEVADTLGNISEKLGANLFSLENILSFVILLAVCLLAKRLVMSLSRRAIGRSVIDKTAHRFILSGLNVILWILILGIMLNFLGVAPSSLVAIISVIGIAISLAIQGVLGNLAGGIMLLTSKPFTTGDWVDVGSHSGKVADVGLVYTKLSSVDNKIIFVPNGEISSKTIVNYTTAANRQVELKFTVSYDADPEVVKGCMARVVGEHTKTLPSPAPLIRTCGFGASSVEYILRAWCATEDYWTVYYDLIEQVKKAFDQAGVEMTYDHMIVHMAQD